MTDGRMFDFASAPTTRQILEALMMEIRQEGEKKEWKKDSKEQR
jgi:hypothetical protein